MVAVIWAVVSSVAVLLGIEGYEYLTWGERVDACVAQAILDNPKLAEQAETVRQVCEKITK